MNTGAEVPDLSNGTAAATIIPLAPRRRHVGYFLSQQYLHCSGLYVRVYTLFAGDCETSQI